MSLPGLAGSCSFYSRASPGIALRALLRPWWPLCGAAQPPARWDLSWSVVDSAARTARTAEL